MKRISQFISELQAAKRTAGDLPISVYNPERGGIHLSYKLEFDHFHTIKEKKTGKNVSSRTVCIVPTEENDDWVEK